MQQISFSLPEKIVKSDDRTEWDECVRVLTEHLNVGLPKKYVDAKGKEKIAQRFTKRGIHFKLLKKNLTLHDLKIIMSTCEKSTHYSWTFNTLLKNRA